MLGCAAVLIAVALWVAFATTGQAYRRETRRVMRDMGQNLRIIPKETSIDAFWARGFSDHSMPEDYVHRFASLKGFSYTHLTATLQQKVLWQGINIILTGILPEVLPLDKLQQSPMTFSVEPGTAYVGHEVARRLQLVSGDTVDVLGVPLAVVKTLSESGSEDDIRVYGHLHDIQRALGMEGRINEIKALECLCLIEASKKKLDPLAVARAQLEEILPEGKVILLQGIAEIRQRQRAAMEQYLVFVLLSALIVCGAWIALLTMLNVRERRCEIGIMRALGYGSARVSMLFMGKSVVMGLIGAAAGYLLGTALALRFGPEMFRVTAKAVRPEYILLGWSLIAAPALTCLASFIPVALAVAYDPVQTLRET